MLVKTAFMYKPIEAYFPWSWMAQTDKRQIDITTYRLNRPKGQFSEKGTLQLPIGNSISQLSLFMDELYTYKGMTSSSVFFFISYLDNVNQIQYFFLL